MIKLLKFVLFCIILCFVFLAYIAYAVLWPVRTLEIKSTQPIHVKNQVLHPGDYIEYDLSYCKYTNIYPVVHRTLIDGQVITLTDTPGKLPQGCHTTTVKTAQIPETINPGHYYLSVDNNYPINPFHTENSGYVTDYFTVVAGTSSPALPSVTIKEGYMSDEGIQY